MTKRTGKIVSVFLSLCLAFSVVSCGNGGKDGENTGNGGGVKDVVSSAVNDVIDNVNGAVSDVKDALTGASPLTVYRMGSDVLGICINSSECKNLLTDEPYGDAPFHFSIHDTDNSEEHYFDCSLTTSGGSVYLRGKGDSEGKSYWNYNRINCVNENTYFIVLTINDFWNRMNFSDEGSFEMFLMNDQKGEGDLIASLPHKEVIKDVSLEELADTFGAAAKLKAPEGKWEGVFLTTDNRDYHGKLEGKVTKNNAIIVSFSVNDENYTYFGYEEPDENNNAENIVQNLKIQNYRSWSDGDNSGDVSVSYRWSHYEGSPDTWENIYYEYRDYAKDIDTEVWYKPYKARYTAPDGYKDEDLCGGKILKKDPGDAANFKPSTDDYVIMAEYNGEWREKRHDRYTLVSFNKNGIAVDYYNKYVFANSADAKAYYDEYYNPAYSTVYVLADNIVYFYYEDFENISQSYCKYDFCSDSYTYLNCHYVYGWKDEDGNYRIQRYISKPYTEADFSLSLEDELMWQTIPQGTHRSLEVKDTTLSTSVSEYNTYFSLYGTDTQGNRFSGYRELKFHGKTAVGCSVTREYNYEIQGYRNFIIFTEFSFDTEVCTVNQYKYAIPESTSEEITFENYKSKTPELTLTGSFDMTRVEQSDYYY